MNNPLDRTLAAAIAEGLIPAEGAGAPQETHPWPVVLLTALGAWLAAIPLLGVVTLLMGDLLGGDAGPYLAGIPILAATLWVLRARSISLFVEQLAFPVLLVGLGSLAFGIARDLPQALAAAVLGALMLGIAALLPRPWLRVLLGAVAAALVILALTFALASTGRLLGLPRESQVWVWVAIHLALALWLIGLRLERILAKRRSSIAAASALEAIGTGWLPVVLAGLAAMSGMTFLAGAVLDAELGGLATELSGKAWGRATPDWVALASSLLVLAATLWGARLWPSLRQPWALGIGAGIAALAWLLPSLGGVWLALVVTATSSRPRLTGVAALAAAWIIGSFYYHLHWPLAHKALALGAAGLLFGALAWLGAVRPSTGTKTSRGRRLAGTTIGLGQGAEPWLILATALATLAVANTGVWQKETLIAEGRRLFIELAPADPRSLMQGDFMRLRFRIPGSIDSELGLLARERPLVVARSDARGVATLRRIHDSDEPLAEGEFPIELTPKNGRWTLVTDAWFFREGDAARWQAARYGEFRVTPDGKALLVGMADAELRPIAPPK